MNRFQDIIHYNRDENSYTARIFESYLFPYWSANKERFNDFVRLLKVASKRGFENLGSRYKQDVSEQIAIVSRIKDSLSFADGMLFLENLDIYAYCKANHIDLKIDKTNIDKTEFDCAVIAEDKEGSEYLFIFEIKCFTNLKPSELKRQIEILEKYKKARLFKDFYHFSLISEENFQRGRNLLENDSKVISLTHVFDYISTVVKPTQKRFNNDIEFKKLHSRIQKADGKQFNPRKLISCKVQNTDKYEGDKLK